MHSLSHFPLIIIFTVCSACLEHNHGISSPIDLKLGMCVFCNNTECSAQKPLLIVYCLWVISLWLSFLQHFLFVWTITLLSRNQLAWNLAYMHICCNNTEEMCTKDLMLSLSYSSFDFWSSFLYHFLLVGSRNLSSHVRLTWNLACVFVVTIRHAVH